MTRLLDYVLDPFASNPFMTRALIGGVLVAISCGVVGTFVVLRGLSFMGEAMGHGALPGIAIAILCGISGLLGAALGALVIILGVQIISRKTSLHADTAIGLLFVGMLALGVAIVSKSDSFTGDLVKVLFGDILGIGDFDLVIQFLITVWILVVVTISARPFLLLSFDEDLTQTSGYNSAVFHFLMLLSIGAAIVSSFRTVGTMLVFGLLVAPAATAALFAWRVATMVAVSIVIGIFSVFFGLLASYHHDLAAGSSIVLTAILFFFAGFSIRVRWQT